MQESAANYDNFDKNDLIKIITILENQTKKYQLEIENLHQALVSMKRQVFGSKSERFLNVNNQLSFLAEIEQPVVDKPQTETITYSRKKAKRGANFKELPIVEQIIEPDIKTCSCCNRALVELGQEVTERVEHVPQKLYKLRIIRKKFACSCKQFPVQIAPLPAQVTALDHCQAGVGLLTQIVIAKYCDHLPLHRQEQIYQRHGVDLSRKRLCDWVMRIANLLDPVARQVKEYLLSLDYIHADETRIKIQATNSTDFIWTIAKKQIYYQYEPGRSKDSANNILGDYKGVIQSDAYTVYKDLNRIGCMAHARRKINELTDCKEKLEILELFAKLYRIEKTCKNNKPDEILKIRSLESVPILDKLKTYFEFIKNKYVPESALVKAVNYSLNDWNALTRYTTNPDYQIDNNYIERLIRPIAIGRKNWLFAQNERGANAAAIFFTLINSAKLVSVNPYDYIKDLLIRVQSHPNSLINELIPINWKAKFNDGSFQKLDLI